MHHRATIPAAMKTKEDIRREKAPPCPSCASAASVSMVLQIEADLPVIYPLTSKVELATDDAHFVCRCSDCGYIWNPDDLNDPLVAKLKVRIAEQKVAKWGSDSYFDR